jgi:hypothetical protein
MTIFLCQGALCNVHHATFLDKENLFACTTAKENLTKLYKKHFHGFAKQKAALTRDKCLTTFRAHEKQNLSGEIC